MPVDSLWAVELGLVKVNAGLANRRKALGLTQESLPSS